MAVKNTRNNTGRERERWENDPFMDINSHSSGRPPRDPFAELFESYTPKEGAGRPSGRASERGGSSSRERPGRTGARPSSGRDRNRSRTQGQSRDRQRDRERAAGPRERASGPRERASGPRERERRPASTSSTRPRTRPEPPPRKRRKPMGLFLRRFLIVLTLLVMLGVTLFLAESLLLRVTDIRVTGDAVYPEEEILSVCGYKTGENLLFIPIADREEALEKQLPYVAQAKISRRVPGTVEIAVTAASPVCSVQAGGGWYVTDSQGKVLEARADPFPGVLQVTGLAPYAAQPGLLLGVEDESQITALQEIAQAIEQVGGSGQFTRLDLTNVHDIRLWYQDRVECVLGSTVELEHKIIYGYGLFNSTKADSIQPDQTGRLDLSYLPENNAAYFEAGEVLPGVQPPARLLPDGAADPNTQQPQQGDSQGSGNEGRGGDIPDDIYLGE